MINRQKCEYKICVDNDEWDCVFDSIAAHYQRIHCCCMCAQASVTKIAAQQFFVRENEHTLSQHSQHREATEKKTCSIVELMVASVRENCTNNKRNNESDHERSENK